MVARLLELRLGVLANRLAGPRRALPGRILAALLVVAAAALGVAVILAQSGTTAEIAGVVLTVLGTAIGLGFALAPLAYGADDPLDPRRFELLGIRIPKLALGTAAAGLASIPVLLLVALLIAQFVAWLPHQGAALVAAVGGLLFLLLCVLAARLASGIAALALASRQARDGAGVLTLAVIAVAVPATAALLGTDWIVRGLPVLRRIAAVAEWSPFGAAWAAPARAATGDAAGAWLMLLVAGAGVLVLALAWIGLVAVMLGHRGRDAGERAHTGLGWFARLPAGPAWAVAARSLSYWARDRRYVLATAVVPVAPLLAVVPLAVGGVPGEVLAWIPVPLMCLLLGWLGHNDLAHDASAFWMHVAANLSGAADRWGRVMPGLLIGVPVAIAGSVLTVLITGDDTMLPALIGLSLCLLLSALGTASLISAWLPYPAVRPGDSPFEQPVSGGGGGAQFLAVLLPLLLSAPVGWLIWLGVTDDEQWLLPAGAAGLGIGVLALAGGIAWGGHLVSRRAPELLAFTLQN